MSDDPYQTALLAAGEVVKKQTLQACVGRTPPGQPCCNYPHPKFADAVPVEVKQSTVGDTCFGAREHEWLRGKIKCVCGWCKAVLGELCVITRWDPQFRKQLKMKCQATGKEYTAAVYWVGDVKQLSDPLDGWNDPDEEEADQPLMVEVRA